MKKLVAALAVLAAVAAFSPQGFNGKSGKSSSGSTIALDSVVSSDGSRLAAGVQPGLGKRVTFATTIEKLAGWEYPMVVVSCTQSGKTVWATVDYPSSAFVLGGTNSDWAIGGGSASCIAQLSAYGWHAGVQSIRTLATTTFDATA